MRNRHIKEVGIYKDSLLQLGLSGRMYSTKSHFYTILILTAPLCGKMKERSEFIRVSVKMLEKKFADGDCSGQARYKERCLQLVTQANFEFTTTTV